MSIYDEMRAELKELLALVSVAEQYTAAVVHGSLQPDQESNQQHEQRVVRIDELSRKLGVL
ncbi:hypothetical protein D3C76_1538070 [compost metagenome]